jgi:hypothetical protein
MNQEQKPLEVGKIEFGSQRDSASERAAEERRKETAPMIVGKTETADRNEREQARIIYIAKSMLYGFDHNKDISKETVINSTYVKMDRQMSGRDLTSDAFQYLVDQQWIIVGEESGRFVLADTGKKVLLEREWSRIKKIFQEEKERQQKANAPFDEVDEKGRLWKLFREFIRDYDLEKQFLEQDLDGGFKWN